MQSIILNENKSQIDFEVCVSDNYSTDETENIVLEAQKRISIKYQKNPTNLGIPQNFLNVIEMAEGEFVWLIGDDDLVLPFALEKLNKLIENHKDVDYFYINSFNMTSEYIDSYPHPFDTKNLPDDMERFSLWTHSGEMKFIDLVNPEISFDYLGGMFLSVFRRQCWNSNISVLDDVAIKDLRTFSYFDNTFPHIKIFAKAFSNSNAYFNAEPLSVSLSGAREWAPMYPFIRSVRLLEALKEYRKNGLSYFKYIKYKNISLRSFIPDIVWMYVNKEVSGYKYINLYKLTRDNCLYPNFYLSIIYFLIRKIRKTKG